MTHLSRLLPLLLLLWWSSCVHINLIQPTLAFVPSSAAASAARYSTTAGSASASSALGASNSRSSSGSGGNGHSEYDDALAHNLRRTDVRIFLTQRAIQSFMFLLVSTRDPHTVRWLETTYECRNLNSYHGTGAFNLTTWTSWDSVLADLIRRPPDVVVVSARRRGRGHGGWSRNNPYLEEIAREWAVDLDTLVASNDQIVKSYYDTIASERDAEECVAFNEDGECLLPEELKAALDGFTTTPRKAAAFDRNAMLMLRNAIAFDERASSPLRKGNFDLLILLATQESVHRLLREYQQMGDQRKVSFEWLRTFYVDRVAQYFDGSQEYGRADDFLEELLLTPPSMKTVGNKVELVDPLRIAEEIIRTRSQVGRDWKVVAAAAPDEHMALRKDLLTARMGGYSSQPSLISTSKTTESTGGFE